MNPIIIYESKSLEEPTEILMNYLYSSYWSYSEVPWPRRTICKLKIQKNHCLQLPPDSTYHESVSNRNWSYV